MNQFQYKYFRVRSFLLLMFLMVSHAVCSQNIVESLQESTTELRKLFEDQMQEPTSDKSETIHLRLTAICKSPSSFTHDFSSLQYCQILDSQDKKLRVLTWADPLHHPEPKYYGFVLFKEGKSTNPKVFELIYRPQTVNEKSTIASTKWYGTIYYRLIENKSKGENTYTLLGWSPLDKSMNHKVIDVLNIEKNHCTFGKSIFRTTVETKSRVYFSYSKQTSMNLNGEEKEIRFDHLSPPSSDMKNMYQFYGPDMTYDKIVWKKGVWTLIENIQ